MADVTVFGELDEGHFAGEHGAHPMRALHNIGGRRLREGALLLFDGREPAPDFGEVLGCEAFTGADAAREEQLTRVVPKSKQERPDPGARAFRIGIAAYHELAPLHAFGLEPALAAPSAVPVASSFGYDTLAT